MRINLKIILKVHNYKKGDWELFLTDLDEDQNKEKFIIEKKKSPSIYSSDIIVESENTTIIKINDESIIENNLILNELIDSEIYKTDENIEKPLKTRKSKMKSLIKDLTYDIGKINKHLTRSVKKINKREYMKYEKMLDKKR